MIPKKLTIEGIYSYQERQSINFEHLTNAGLFGIFGHTGSGKSSVLDAISYALFGIVDRLKGNVVLNYNLMNLKAKEAFIELEFYNYKNNLYKVTKKLKRNTKNFEKINTVDSVFYKMENDNWIPLEHTNAEKIIGLNYENFKRTIIIPQDKFKEFINLKPADRTQMMKEVFQLYRFDLFDNVKSLLRKNTSKLDKLEGNLAAYNLISKEAIKEKKDEYNSQNKVFKEQENKYKILLEQYQKLKHLNEDFKILKEKKAEFKKLMEQHETFLELREKVDVFEKTEKIFNHLLLDFKKEKKLAQELSIKKETAKSEFKYINEQLENNELKLNELKPYFQQLTEKKEEAADLKILKNLLQLSEEIETSKKKADSQKKSLTETKKQEIKFKKQEQLIRNKIQTLENNQPDHKLLRETGEWYKYSDYLKEKEASQIERLNTEKIKLENIFNELKSKNINIRDFEIEAKKSISKNEETLQFLKKRKETLLVNERLIEHAKTLNDEKPCPLCGSLEHPEILNIENLSEALKKVENDIIKVENSDKEIQQKINYFQVKSSLIIELKKNILIEKENLERIKEKIKYHNSKFVWTNFDANNKINFERQVKAAEDIEEEIKRRRKELERAQNETELISQKTEQQTKLLNQYELNFEKKTTEFKTLESSLKRFNFSDYSNLSKEALQNEFDLLNKMNIKVEKQYEELTVNVNELKPQLAGKEAELKSYDTQLNDKQSNIISLQKKIDEKLIQSKFNTIENVQQVLNQKIDIAKERKKIEIYQAEISAVRGVVKDLKEKITSSEFSEEKFTELEKKYIENEVKINKLRKQLILLSDTIKKETEKLKEKVILETEKNKLNIRKENLNLMFNLFKASGFVDYVSTIYLSQLCDVANERFKKLTKNQLSLTLGEKNNFEVIDYLNDGRKRSVKTLSGGQAFQVSLSLALALAESVQSNSKAERNFFFIDEGFGTQDEDSIHIIFETLLNLHKENKIVGIISHVEELKERIPQSLLISLDKTRGSLIKINN